MELLATAQEQILPVEQFLCAELVIRGQLDPVGRVRVLVHAATRVTVRRRQFGGDEHGHRIVQFGGRQPGRRDLSGEHLERGSRGTRRIVREEHIGPRLLVALEAGDGAAIDTAGVIQLSGAANGGEVLLFDMAA